MKFSTMFHISNILTPLKNNSSKVKNKTRNTFIKRDTERSEELVLTRKIVILEQSVV